MKKRGLILALLCSFAISIVACGGEAKSSQNTSPPKESTEKETQKDEAKTEETPAEKETPSTFELGQTWEVDGQWKLTINSITEMEDRNEYAEKTPAAVYSVDYTYENLGYEDENGLMDGLFFDLSSDQIIDSAGTMGYSYPNDSKSYPQEVPVGANLTADVPIGVDNAGNFTIIVSQYDGTGAEQKATFSCTVQ